jgi:hypothetical protein
MTKTSAKVIEKVDELVKAQPTKAKIETLVTHYVGCFMDTKNAESTIQNLQSNERFPSLKYINHRPMKDGKRTQVWLSTLPGEFTINNS